ncbi:MAG: hypothetical protein PWP46_1696, partial [Fusobacteriaceae bacterium]|nr:hypothetical protein [Fusobacteriaceae bacterium]
MFVEQIKNEPFKIKGSLNSFIFNDISFNYIHLDYFFANSKYR